MTNSKNGNVFIIGPMGAGKTTVGKKLAKKLNKIFIDSDKEIEKRTGASISLIFDVEGESGFREWEKKILAELAKENDIVLATGGGAILSESNRKILMKKGLVIYLEASPELIFKRTAYDNSRPLLDTKDRAETINELLKTRKPIYENCADFTINVDKKSADRIINEICNWIDTK